jgi:beta-phosphoglucomutase-like phosphatase (HAD superfamily)
MDRLLLCLRVLGIDQEFLGGVFGADPVPRGKPSPDIFLYAAAKIGVAPSDCIVIEDSASGVQAGVAAGMTVIGLCAANHCRAGHAERLSEAGAYCVVDSWLEVATLFSHA